MYLKRENLYKSEFEEIKLTYRNLKIETEKTICKNCIIQIMMTGGIHSLLTTLNISQPQKEINNNVEQQSNDNNNIPLVEDNGLEVFLVPNEINFGSQRN